MNHRIVAKYMGYIMLVEAVFMIPAAALCLYYGEKSMFQSFLPAIALPACLGLLLGRLRTKESISMGEGFVICSLGWIVMSVFGSFPFFFSRMIPRYIDCWFETVSGFTTTGSTILTDVEALPRGLLYWRSFTHWIGGMGVLVFLLAIVPLSKGNGQFFNLMKAESPGPSVGKLLPKISDTAKITYAIYFALTVTEVVFLLVGGMPLYDAVVLSLGTAGTGGFAHKADSIAGYSQHLQKLRQR